jgi:hypothetical protein
MFGSSCVHPVSVAANWIEADEGLSKKDFLMRVKICRKEAKESSLFLRLVDTGLTKSTVAARDGLMAEAPELTPYFFIYYLEERVVSPRLTIEICLGFGN